MYHMVSEATLSEMDRAGRILIPSRLRKLIPVDDEQEVVIVGMFHRLEVWNPSEMAPLCSKERRVVRTEPG